MEPKITYTCPVCGIKHTVTPTEYEETLSWSDPHNPYSGEWLRCPICYHAKCVSDTVPVEIHTLGRTVKGYLSADDAFLYILNENKEVVMKWD